MSLTLQTKADGPQTSDKMAAVCLLALMAGLMSEVYGVPAEENTGKTTQHRSINLQRRQLKVRDMKLYEKASGQTVDP